MEKVEIANIQKDTEIQTHKRVIDLPSPYPWGVKTLSYHRCYKHYALEASMLLGIV